MSVAAATVVELLRDRGRTLAVAESLTGGLLSSTIVAVPGASAVLRGALVPYATELKVTLLGVSPRALRAGPVHPEVAMAMASGARTALGADLALATTGVAGPARQGGQDVGVVWVGLADNSGPLAYATAWPEGRKLTRNALRQHCCDQALAILYRYLELGVRSGAEDFC